MLLFLAILCLAGTAQAQFGVGSGCVTVNFSPLSPQYCTWTISVSAKAVNAISGAEVMLAPQTITLYPATTGTACFNPPSGYTVVPGAYVFGITNSNGAVNFTLDYAYGSPGNYVVLSKNCSTTSNCKTNWSKVSNSQFTLAPGCTTGP